MHGQGAAWIIACAILAGCALPSSDPVRAPPPESPETLQDAAGLSAWRKHECDPTQGAVPSANARILPRFLDAADVQVARLQAIVDANPGPWDGRDAAVAASDPSFHGVHRQGPNEGHALVYYGHDLWTPDQVKRLAAEIYHAWGLQEKDMPAHTDPIVENASMYGYDIYYSTGQGGAYVEQRGNYQLTITVADVAAGEVVAKGVLQQREVESAIQLHTMFDVDDRTPRITATAARQLADTVRDCLLGQAGHDPGAFDVREPPAPQQPASLAASSTGYAYAYALRAKDMPDTCYQVRVVIDAFSAAVLDASIASSQGYAGCSWGYIDPWQDESGWN